MSIEVLIKKRNPDSPFGGTTPMDADIDNHLTPTERKGIEAFGRRLAQQMSKGKFRDDPRLELIGVSLISITFALRTQVKVEQLEREVGR